MSKIGDEHLALVHPDGSECPDGCDLGPASRYPRPSRAVRIICTNRLTEDMLESDLSERERFFLKTVRNCLPSPLPDPQDEEQIRIAIIDHCRSMWTVYESASYLLVSEYCAPNFPEDMAIRRMTEITESVRRRKDPS